MFLSLRRFFKWFGVTPPNHPVDVQFPAILLIGLAIMFVPIGLSHVHYRHMIPKGISLKVAFCTDVFMHWFTTGIPDMWKPFAVCNAVSGLLFFLAYRTLRKSQTF